MYFFYNLFAFNNLKHAIIYLSSLLFLCANANDVKLRSFLFNTKCMHIYMRCQRS